MKKNFKGESRSKSKGKSSSKSRKRIRIMAIAMGVMICFGLLMGCATQAPSGVTTTAAPGETNTGAPTSGVANATYPLNIKDAFGKNVSIETEPVKVVSLSPTATEIVFALGAGAKLVGRTDYCDFPKEAAAVKSVGEIVNPSVETIVSMKPNLIFATDMTKSDTLNKLKELGIAVYLLNDKKGIDGAFKSIEDFGQLLNAQTKASEIVGGMKVKQGQIALKIARAALRPSVYYVVGFGQYGDWTPGAGTFIDEAIKLAGGVNSGATAVNWKFSFEQLIKSKPSIIICQANPDDRAAFMKADKYKDLPAVKAGDVFSIDNNKLDRAGPRIIQGIEDLSRIIQPAFWM